MGNIGGPEIFMVLIVALLVLGPTRLPQAARQMGKAMAEFRRVTGGLQAEIRDAVSHLETEINKTIEPETSTTPPPPPALTPPAPAPYVFDPPQVGVNPVLMPEPKTPEPEVSPDTPDTEV